MTIEKLFETLRERAPSEPAAAERWNAAVSRLEEAASAPTSFSEIAARLPPKPRYLGPGPWLDSIRDANMEVQ